MSKKKTRKTRLKGTATTKPCLGCGKTKNRFTEFKPRWAGCETHRTERGRRYFQPGCEPCKAKVNGNIRQPHCIECDSARSKKRKKAPAAPKPTPAPKVVEPQTIPDNQTLYGTENPRPVVSGPVVAKPKQSEIETAVLPPRPLPVAETKAKTETKVVGLPEPSAESVEVPAPVTEPAPKPERPIIATISDLQKLLDG